MRRILRAFIVGCALSAALLAVAVFVLAREDGSDRAGPSELAGRTDQGAVFHLRLDRERGRIRRLATQVSAFCPGSGSWGHDWTAAAGAPFQFGGNSFTVAQTVQPAYRDGTRATLVLTATGDLTRNPAEGTVHMDATVRHAGGRISRCDSGVVRWRAPVRRPLNAAPKGPARLIMVPLDGVEADDLEPIAKAVASRYGVRPQIRSRVRSPAGARDAERDQWEGETIIDSLVDAPAADPGVAIIAVTDRDLYWAKRPAATFYFDFARTNQSHALISTFRLDPSAYGEPADPRLRAARLRKLVTRYLGRLAFGLRATSTDPRSVLRRSYSDVATIDAMSERFCPDRETLVDDC